MEKPFWGTKEGSQQVLPRFPLSVGSHSYKRGGEREESCEPGKWERNAPGFFSTHRTLLLSVSGSSQDGWKSLFFSSDAPPLTTFRSG